MGAVEEIIKTYRLLYSGIAAGRIPATWEIAVDIVADLLKMHPGTTPGDLLQKPYTGEIECFGIPVRIVEPGKGVRLIVTVIE